MKYFIVLAWLILSAEILGFTFICLSQANTIQNYAGLIMMAVWLFLSYKTHLGIKILSLFKQKNKATK